MKAIILAAGRGTRLGALTRTTPKPMLTIGGVPLIERHIRWLRAAGISDIVVNVHHLAQRITDHLGDGSTLGVRLTYSPERALLETGGAIVRALPLLGADPFVYVLGDVYSEFPPDALSLDLAADADMHMVLTPTPTFRDQGDFEHARGRVTRRGNAFVFCGYAVVRPSIFEPYAPAAGSDWPVFSFRELMFDAVANNRATAQIWRGYWSDIGTPDQLSQTRAHHAAHQTGTMRQ